MILTRVEERRAEFEAVIDAEPRTPREAAGVIAWYDRSGWIWLQVTFDAENGRHLRVVRRDGAVTTRSAPIAAPDGPLRLRASLDGPGLAFAVAGDDGEWREVPGVHPAWTLSDDHGPRLRFTGMFLGVRADDLDGRGWTVDVDRASVRFFPPQAS
jgi:xylan 1,4-beta-xylosidase